MIARPLRIAHVVDAPFASTAADGVPQVVHALARAQADAGQPVAVFSSVDGAHFLGRDPAAAAPTAPRSIRRSSATWLDRRFTSRYLDPRLADAVLAWQPDVVHCHSVHVPRHVALGIHLSRAGIPYCVTPHGALFPAALRRGRLKKTLFNLLFERRYLNEARFIHAVSPREAAAIQAYGVYRPIAMVPNGLAPDAAMRPTRPDALYRFAPSLRGRRIFMFIGRLDPWQKGLDLLVDAFAAARLRDAALVLVGPEYRGSRRSLARRAERLGSLREIVFTGPAFGDDRASLFAGADVFVHPSRWEGLSLSVLAAAAAGKPCLITREADPLGELERGEAAMLVEPTLPSLAAGLARAAALGDRERQALGARARDVAERFSTWPAIAGRLVAAYRDACGDRREQQSA